MRKVRRASAEGGLMGCWSPSGVRRVLVWISEQNEDIHVGTTGAGREGVCKGRGRGRDGGLITDRCTVWVAKGQKPGVTGASVLLLEKRVPNM